MKAFDYIIVGQGIAGTVLAFQLRLKGRRVFVIDKHRDHTSSKIALGTYNPMVLKRFTPCWKVEDQLTPLYDFLDAFEKSFNTSIHEPLNYGESLRLFKSKIYGLKNLIIIGSCRL